MFRYAVSLLVSACLLASGAACTSGRILAKPDADTIVERVRVGDSATIFAKNGKRHLLDVTEVGENYLRGIDPETSKRYRVPFDQIQSMSYERYSSGKTVGAAAIGLGVLAVAAIIAAWSSVGRSFGDSWNWGGGC